MTTLRSCLERESRAVTQLSLFCSLQDVLLLLLCLLSSYLSYDWASCFGSFPGRIKICQFLITLLREPHPWILKWHITSFFPCPHGTLLCSIISAFFKSMYLFEFDLQFSKLYLFSNMYLLLHCGCITLSQ